MDNKTEKEIEKEGKWLKVLSKGNHYRCSECNVIALITLYPHGDKNYCPNCGAKMTN